MKCLPLLVIVLYIFGCSSFNPVKNNKIDTKPESWKLVWQEEFDYEGLPDPNTWTFEIDGNSWDWGNGEDQFYTENRKENAIVNSGTLKIKALKENYVESKKYTSARINSKKVGGWKYGKIEVMAKLPQGQGIWPAIWMLPVDSVYGGWPNSGEIDIMEYFSHLPGKSYSTIHTKTYNHKIGTSIGSHIKSDTLHNDFHLYSLEWYENRLEMYFDDKLVMTYDNPNKTYAEWPFDKPFHLLLNCAVGGDWIRSNGGIDDSIFPQTFEVDYVRVYEAIFSGEHKLNVISNSGGNVKKSADKEYFSGGEKVSLIPEAKKDYVFQQWTNDASGNAIPLEVVMGRDKEIGAAFVKEGEIIKNSDFSNGLLGWDYWYDNKVVSSEHNTEDNTFIAKISSIGEYAWQAQLNQNIALENGNKYIISFEAMGTIKNTKVAIQQSIDPYMSYWATDYILDDNWNTYSFEATLNGMGEETRLEFNFGGSKGDISIRNVSVIKQ